MLYIVWHMNEVSKLTLSAEELQLVTDTGFILTKHTILSKVNLLLGSHAAFTQQNITLLNLPVQVTQQSPKIAKGENYLQLPWLMLDYPRLFDKETVFAVRTMFWWGNFFSCTLHISGKYKDHFATTVAANIHTLPQQSFFICVGEDEWQHHFEADNYTALNTITTAYIEKIINEKKFIKIACRFNLQQWAQMPLLLQQSFITLVNLLKN